MKGVGACTALQELYLSHNGITEMEVCMRPEGHMSDLYVMSTMPGH